MNPQAFAAVLQTVDFYPLTIATIIARLHVLLRRASIYDPKRYLAPIGIAEYLAPLAGFEPALSVPKTDVIIHFTIEAFDSRFEG